MKQKERNSNFELMRIFSMLFIILWHIYMYGGIRKNPRIINNGVSLFFEFIIFVLIVHANSFVIVSGYFQHNKKFELKKLFSLIDISLFYRIIIVCALLFLNIISISKVELIKYFSPLVPTYNIEYWFIRVFTFLYIFSPFLNILINKMTKKQHFHLLLVSFLIFSIFPFISGNMFYDNYGYTLCNFIFLYFIGSFISKYKVKDIILEKISVNLYRLILIIVFILLAIFNYCIYKTSSQVLGMGNVISEFSRSINSMHIAYSNPFVIVQTIVYMLFFETFSFKSKIINKISSLTLGIYLIHNNTYLTQFIYKWLKIDNGNVYSYKFIIYCLAMVFVIFISAGIIELIRQLFVKFIQNRKIIKKIKEMFYSFLNSFYIKDNN